MVILDFPQSKTATLPLMKLSKLKIFKRHITRHVHDRKKQLFLIKRT